MRLKYYSGAQVMSIIEKLPDKEYLEMLNAFAKEPSADVVEVVTCKDCVHLELLNSENYYARCNWHGRLFPSFGNPDTRYYFCADCQRKEE